MNDRAGLSARPRRLSASPKLTLWLLASLLAAACSAPPAAQSPPSGAQPTAAQPSATQSGGAQPTAKPAGQSQPASGQATSGQVAQPKPSDETVAVALNVSLASLEPTTGSISWNLLQLGIGETLAIVNREGNVVPWLARSWRQANERDWQIELREGVRFHDGKAVDAAAVKRSLERSVAKLPQIASLANVEAITVDGPLTLTVRTKALNPAFGSLLAHYNFVIHDAELAEAQPAQFATAPNLTGAFKPTEFKADSGLKLARNTSYWGDPAQVAAVDVRFIVDPNTRLNALLSRQVDLAYQLSQENAGQVERQSDLVLKSVTTGYQYFAILNTSRPQFADRGVRQLLSQAVDRAALASQVLRGGAEPARAAFSPVFPFALQEGYGYEPQKAASGLDAAGWRVGPDGVRQKDGVRLAFSLITYPQRPELGQIGIALQAQLKALGVAVELRQVDQINEALKEQFDAALYATNTAPTGDPGLLLNVYYRTGGASNFGRFSQPTIDESLDRLNATADAGQRAELARQIQRDLLTEAPHIYLVVPKFRIGLSQRLRDYEPFPSDYYVIDNRLRVAR